MKKILLSCIINFVCIGSAFAWDIQLEDNEYTPSSMVVVDKGEQQLSYLEKHSPLSIRHKYPSIHGEFEGDKETEGDLKTPEGVYFVTTRIYYPLDFEKYGSQAHALNYPNPVDRLRGKTGSGIWIHSKGKPIKSQKTEGCIAIDLNHIEELEPLLKPGIPVIVAQGILHASLALDDKASQIAAVETGNFEATDLNVQKELAKLTKEWNNAWASRSNDFFDFYDKASYTKAQRRSFSRFREQKEYLFAKMHWMYIKHEKINVLQGPGYWVTWFNQYYRAPNVRVEGIRRLYWQADEKGGYKVVGMEWLPQKFGFEQKFRTDALRTIPEFIESWKLAWKDTNSTNYAAFYTKDAVQDSNKMVDTIVARKKALWESKKPVEIEFSDMTINIRNDAIYVRMKQKYSDTSGYEDIGTKSLVLYPHGDSWLIASEKWKR